jgi:hypothetical protein
MRPATATGRLLFAAPLIAVLCGPASAQTSASFKVTESVINAGGHPLDASRPGSASFRISHGAIGDAAARSVLSSASYRGDGGFVARYAPPGEVHGVQFLDKINLTWSHEPSVGIYNLYRSTLASLPGNYGSCYQPALVGPPYGETDAPAQGSGWLYLVTAENRLREEGTKGHTSSGAERSNLSACP